MLTRSHLIASGLVIATVAAGAVARNSPPSGAPVTLTASKPGKIKFTGTLDRNAVLLGGDGQARIELVMAADDVDRHGLVRQPTDLVVVLDRSGSMLGVKMEQARAAVLQLIKDLGADDRFAVVTYADAASIALPLSRMGREDYPAWASAIEAIQADGSTNMSGGLDLAFDLIGRNRQAGRVPHVILISDGQANSGDSSPEGLTSRARQAARGEYMLSSVGVGADFNEYLMTAIADAGSGNYYYLRDTHSLAEVFAREFGAARATVASGVAVRIEPADGVSVVDAAGYPLETDGDAVVFRPGSLFAGQERRVWVTLIARHDAAGEYDLGRFSLAYTEPAGERATLSFDDSPRVACVESEDRFLANVDVPAWGRSVVVDEYNKMKEEVARSVKGGEREKALQRIDDFRERTAGLNAKLHSAPVTMQLGVADALEAEVKDAFAPGADQAQRQNDLSKSASAAALGARRTGSTK